MVLRCFASAVDSTDALEAVDFDPGSSFDLGRVVIDLGLETGLEHFLVGRSLVLVDVG